MLDDQLTNLAPLWTTEINVLLNRDAESTDLSRCLIINRRLKTVKLIENRELAMEVIRRMRAAGVEVVRKLPND